MKNKNKREKVSPDDVLYALNLCIVVGNGFSIDTVRFSFSTNVFFLRQQGWVIPCRNRAGDTTVGSNNTRNVVITVQPFSGRTERP